jgi:2-dehydro-3-deoxygalactonokinase
LIHAAIIGVDWGSTHVRAFRFGEDGAVLETRRGEGGSSGLAPGDYEAALHRLLGDWLDEAPEKIIVCGMAGSREGWIEAAYVAAPCALSAVADALVRAPSALPVYIAPGLIIRNADGVPDVMRGEETQILGALDSADAAWAVAPGTHSKWVELSDRRVSRFHTYMTGELYRLMATQSVLARQIDARAPWNEAAFDRGVARALEGSALPRLLFGARAQVLAGDLRPADSGSYLSGLLIGAEIADAARFAALTAPVLLIGAADITAPYRRALAQAGASRIRVVDGEAAAARGLWRLAHPEAAT